MTAKLFLVTLLCIFLLEITSTTLLQKAKRVCRRAAHNWRLIKSPPRKMFTKNISHGKRMTPKPYLKFRTELYPVEVKHFVDREESIVDTQIMESKNDQFTLLHKMDRIVDIVENEYVVSDETEFSYDFDEFDDLLDAIDLFEIPTIESLHYCGNEDDK